MNTSLENILVKDYRLLKKRKKHQLIEYLELYVSFDIETSSWYEKNEKRACMYAYGIAFFDKVKIGRTWSEFKEDIEKIVDYYGLNINKRLIIWIHNLSYEFQFIRKLFKWNNVFALNEREVCYAVTINGIEFRCSYILSNSSLENLGKNLIKYKVEKLVGNLDYDKIRNSSTPLTEKEVAYLENDCKVVTYYIRETSENEGNLMRVPLTNTGFVRKFIKSKTITKKENYKYRGLIKRLKLSTEVFLMLQNAFMGGFTHANHLWSKAICKNVASYDLTSSYPTAMCSEKYPMSSGYKIKVFSKQGLYNLMDTYCVLMDVTFFDIEETFTYDHYISESKCFVLEDKKVDNGRIVKARLLRIILTDIDFKIIDKTYKYKDFKVNCCYIFKKDYLPKEFIESILDLYEKKTTLKEVEGKEVDYMRSKNQINSCYGMCVTNPCRETITYKEDEWGKDLPNVEKALEHYNIDKGRFLYYAWGIWITAYARNNLWKGILSIGRDYIYSDTDSLKVLNKEKHETFFKEYNNEIINKLTTCLMYYDIDINKIHPKNKYGEEKYLGIWDYEGYYELFKTLGAKRYMMSNGDNLKITIAGVNKKTGAIYLKYKYKNIKDIYLAFDEDLVFPATYNDKGDIKKGSGKMTHTYIDIETKGKVTDYLGNVADYHELSSVHLENTSYSLSIAQAYIDYLKGIEGDYLWQNKNTTLLLK